MQGKDRKDRGNRQVYFREPSSYLDKPRGEKCDINTEERGKKGEKMKGEVNLKKRAGDSGRRLVLRNKQPVTQRVSLLKGSPILALPG